MRCRHVAKEGTAEAGRCGFRLTLDMDTLVVSKGPSFELAKLAARLICPKCRGREISIVWFPSETPTDQGERLALIPGARESKSAVLFGGKFTVDEFDRQTGGLIQRLVSTEHFRLALASFDAAHATWPNRHILFRQGMHVFRDSDEVERNKVQTGT